MKDFINLFIGFLSDLGLEGCLLALSLFGNALFALFKLKGSRLEKDYKKAVKNVAAEKYYCKVAGKYYLLSDIQFIAKDSISSEEFYLHKG